MLTFFEEFYIFAIIMTPSARHFRTFYFKHSFFYWRLKFTEITKWLQNCRFQNRRLYCSWPFFLLLFVWDLSSHLRIFHSYWDVTITGMATNFDLCSAYCHRTVRPGSLACHTYIVLWHWPSIYNGHLRGHVTLTPISERLAVELSLPVFTT